MNQPAKSPYPVEEKMEWDIQDQLADDRDPKCKHWLSHCIERTSDNRSNSDKRKHDHQGTQCECSNGKNLQ